MPRILKEFEAFPSTTFKDPDTGHIHTGKNLKELYTNIINYRIQNQLEPILYLDQVVSHYLCSLPENCNRCRDTELKRGFMIYLKGGLELIRRTFYPEFVDQKVADERAAQCVKCPNNFFPDKDVFFKWADDYAVDRVGERKSRFHQELGNCSVCTCVLRSKVFMGGEFPKFTEEQVEKMKAVNCWQLKSSGQS